jgi:hypothetical protein
VEAGGHDASWETATEVMSQVDELGKEIEAVALVSYGDFLSEVYNSQYWAS